VDGAREAVAKFGACLDVCRRAVPPNHDLAALGLKAAAECLAYLASLTPTTIAGTPFLVCRAERCVRDLICDAQW
jgi:hypothetical protein